MVLLINLKKSVTYITTVERKDFKFRLSGKNFENMMLMMRNLK